ncbi:MAG TPA: hypothetical protein VI112_01195 [Bacteroidia bacterium]|jgi:hypothetical protein
MRPLLFFFAFLASGFLSGAVIHWTHDKDGYEIFYVAGLIFGITYVTLNKLIVKATALSLLAIILSSGAYLCSVIVAMNIREPFFLTGFIGAGITGIFFMLFFGVRWKFVLAAAVAGGLLGMLMLVTDMDHGYGLAYTFSAWQGVVGTLLSLGFKEKDANMKAELK